MQLQIVADFFVLVVSSNNILCYISLIFAFLFGFGELRECSLAYLENECNNKQIVGSKL
jgi:hypothetical protein